MTGPCERAVLRLASLVLALALAAATQTLAADYRAPRTSFGAPDIDGVWSNNSLTQLERPDDLKTLALSEAEAAAYEKKHLGQPPELPGDTLGGAESEWWETQVGLARIRGLPRTSWIVSPSDGQMPFTAEAQAAGKAARDKRKTDFSNPEGRTLSERCLATDAAGPPMTNGGYNDNYQFVQTRDQIAIMSEYGHDVRIVRLSASRHLPADIRRWMGDSIGHWEGDTLVIETTNFTPAEVNPQRHDPEADMRVVERITRISPTELTYEFSVEAPTAFVQTWRGEMVFHQPAGPIYEFACHEGNYAMEHILSGGRQQDAAAAKSAAATPSPPRSAPSP